MVNNSFNRCAQPCPPDQQNGPAILIGKKKDDELNGNGFQFDIERLVNVGELKNHRMEISYFDSCYTGSCQKPNLSCENDLEIPCSGVKDYEFGWHLVDEVLI